MVTLPRLIGHRGARAVAPENTLAGFRAAAAAGAGWVEFDVRLSADGVPVLMHDERVDRTTDGRGAVGELSWAELARLDAGARFAERFRGETVPSLADAVAELARLGLGANVEIKPTGTDAATAASVIAAALAGCWPRRLPAPVVSSFDRGCLAASRAAAPDLPCALLSERLSDDWQAAAAAFGCVAIHLGDRYLMQSDIAAVRATRLPLVVWTVNEPERARRLFAAGITSIITDDPGALATAAERVGMDGNQA